ncbi:MAG: NAD-dependent epimerase/dehydratase family protein [Planctomycetota bacterium]
MGDRAPKRILYLGGTGEISAACVAESLSRGDHVTVLNRGSAAPPEGVEHIKADMWSDGWADELKGYRFDLVCQFMSFGPEDIARDAAGLAEVCDRYVFISTACVYARPEVPDPELRLITESSPVGNPHSAYGRNKQAAEDAVRDAESRGVWKATIVRPSHTYRRYLPCPIIPFDEFARRALAGQAVPCHTVNGEVTRWAVTHAGDFARWFAALVADERSAGETFNLVSEVSHPWDEILRRGMDALGARSEIEYLDIEQIVNEQPDRAEQLYGDMALSVQFDCSRVRDMIADALFERPLEAGLSEAACAVRRRLTDPIRTADR